MSHSAVAIIGFVWMSLSRSDSNDLVGIPTLLWATGVTVGFGADVVVWIVVVESLAVGLKTIVWFYTLQVQMFLPKDKFKTYIILH